MGENCLSLHGGFQRSDGFSLTALEFRWYAQFRVAILDDIETNMLFWEDSQNVLKSRFLLLVLLTGGLTSGISIRKRSFRLLL